VLLLLSQTLTTFVNPSDPLLASTLLITAYFFGLCLICSHLLRGILIGLRSRGLTWSMMLLRLMPWLMLFAGVVGYLVSVATIHLLPTELTVETPEQTSQQQFLIEVIYNANVAFLILTFWVVCYFVHHLLAAYQNAQMERLNLEISIREAELRHLRSQMDPHFLFNSLNTVRALISPENQEARGALTHLSELLRNSLRQGEKPLIPLKDELVALASHLAIEELRFGERLRMSLHLAPHLEACLVPPFLIQTLVENAIKHGISKREQGGTITLRIFKNDSHLCCVVRNSGVLEISKTESHGLKNTRARLLHLYQESACFSLEQIRPNQVRAAFRIPIQTASHPL
jgi:two-component system, LytTR family, sensor kinase